jgi:hypothetical protein
LCSDQRLERLNIVGKCIGLGRMHRLHHDETYSYSS